MAETAAMLDDAERTLARTIRSMKNGASGRVGGGTGVGIVKDGESCAVFHV